MSWQVNSGQDDAGAKEQNRGGRLTLALLVSLVSLGAGLVSGGPQGVLGVALDLLQPCSGSVQTAAQPSLEQSAGTPCPAPWPGLPVSCKPHTPISSKFGWQNPYTVTFAPVIKMYGSSSCHQCWLDPPPRANETAA